jgi:hypothetical protein
MLMRICLIVAILAGLGVAALNFTKVKEKIEFIQGQRDTEKKDKETAQNDLRKTKSDLKQTADKLKQTETTLAATVEERDTVRKDLDAQTKLGNKLKGDLDKATKERDDAKAELAAYSGTGLKPEEIIAIKKSYKGLEDQLAEDKVVMTGLRKKVDKLETRLAVFENPDKPVLLRGDLRGKVLVTDPKWNFVVLNVGEDQGVKEQGELLVNRNGRLVAKVKVRSVQKDRCVANILPGWQLGDVLEGDLVIPAYPAS